MSEHAPKNHEQHHAPAEHSAEHQERLQKAHEAAEKAHHEHKDAIENIRRHVKHEAVSRDDSKAHESAKDRPQTPLFIDKVVRQQSYKKSLQHIQRQLPKGQRAFSKFVHRPVVERLSDISSKTVARPSGLLGAGFCAFLGTTAVVWISRHYGYEYKFSTFLALVAVGFVLGLIGEWLVRSLARLVRR